MERDQSAIIRRGEGGETRPHTLKRGGDRPDSLPEPGRVPQGRVHPHEREEGKAPKKDRLEWAAGGEKPHRQRVEESFLHFSGLWGRLVFL